jgi:hypothetical protein
MIATGGYLHFCLYRQGYRFIPKIGVSLLVQVGASAVVAAALFVTPKADFSRLAFLPRPVSLARFAGVGLSLGTLGAFWLTRTGRGLFGFQERGFNPAPQALLALLSESAAAVVLLALIVVEYRCHPLCRPIEQDDLEMVR